LRLTDSRLKLSDASASLYLRRKDLLGPVTRVTKKKKKASASARQEPRLTERIN
jgi:hypothetical protein